VWQPGWPEADISPSINAFGAILVSRAAEQIIHLVAQPCLPVKIVGHYSGVSASMEGAPHHAVFDLGILMQVPNMEVYTRHAQEGLARALAMAMSSTDAGIPSDQPRTSRSAAQCALSLGPMHLRLRRDGSDVLVTHGSLLEQCLDAADGCGPKESPPRLWRLLAQNPSPHRSWKPC